MGLSSKRFLVSMINLLSRMDRRMNFVLLTLRFTRVFFVAVCAN